MLKKISIILICILITLLILQSVNAMSMECSQEHARLIADQIKLKPKEVGSKRISVDVVIFLKDIDNAIRLCKGTINEPSLILLKGQIYEEKLLHLDKEYSQYYNLAYGFKDKYPSIAENGLYKLAQVSFLKGDCSTVYAVKKRFDALYPNPRKSYQDMINKFVNACDKKNGIDKTRVKLFNEGYGEGDKLDVLFFGYGYEYKDEFIEDASYLAFYGTERTSSAEILRQSKYRNKFNFHYYDLLLDNSTCSNSGKRGGSCKCEEKKLKQIAKNAGMDRYVVLMRAKDAGWCRANAILSERAYVVVPDVKNRHDRVNSFIYLYKYYKDLVAEELYLPDGTSYEDHYKGKYKPNDLVSVELYTPTLLLYQHEVGHAYYGLQDEYTEEGKRDDPGKPNCADSKSQAKEWWGDLVGQQMKYETNHIIESSARDVNYYEGCSYTEDNFRPTFNSAMRQQRDFGYAHIHLAYGPVNDKHIKKILDAYD